MNDQEEEARCRVGHHVIIHYDTVVRLFFTVMFIFRFVVWTGRINCDWRHYFRFMTAHIFVSQDSVPKRLGR